MEVLYHISHIRSYFAGRFPYIGLIYGRYLQVRFLKGPLIEWLPVVYDIIMCFSLIVNHCCFTCSIEWFISNWYSYLHSIYLWRTSQQGRKVCQWLELSVQSGKPGHVYTLYLKCLTDHLYYLMHVFHVYLHAMCTCITCIFACVEPA